MKYLRSDLQTWHHQSKSKGEQNDTRHAVAMATVLLLVLFKYKLKFPVFFATKIIYSQKSIEERFDNMGSMSVPSRTLCLTFKGCKLGYLFLDRKGLEPSGLSWQPNHRFHFVRCLIWISSAKFKEHHANISRDIIVSVFKNIK